MSYLTKSRFKVALECQTKLYYNDDPLYANQKIDDPFLESLAEGGYQVGELAKMNFPGGIAVETRIHKEAIEMTDELLKKENAIIYEAAFNFKNLFIRTDILIKEGNSFQLIEVKAKSFDGEDYRDFLNKSGKIATGWRPYVFDVAFQRYVLSKAKPGFQINAYLMLADKNAKTSVEGLNQCFPIVNRNGEKRVLVKESLSKEDLGNEILININIDPLIDNILNRSDFIEKEDMSFEEWLDFLSTKLKTKDRIWTDLGKKCKSCEFKCTETEIEKKLKSGFEECWARQAGFSKEDFKKPTVLDIWDFRRKDQLISEGRFFMEDVTDEDISSEKSTGGILSKDERKWLQIEKAVSGDKTPYLDKKGIAAEIKGWKYPLHFIDFETTALAIPFNKGLRPYEGVAFQFSHHQVEHDGSIKHKGQYLNLERGKFPSFNFIRALKAQLEHDEGTIFRYHNHENTYLNIIYNQLKNATKTDVPDKDDLINFIKDITHSGGKTEDSWVGKRDMIDLYQLVIKYYYHPMMGGSNSIKVVLPASLNASEFLQKKYVQPIYGDPDIIPSLNFGKMSWIQYDLNKKVINPYNLLPPLDKEYNDDELSSLFTDLEIKEGGAAMMAYARMQFTEMNEEEAKRIQQALLRYCELDTFAMVLIWEYWANEVT